MWCISREWTTCTGVFTLSLCRFHGPWTPSSHPLWWRHTMRCFTSCCRSSGSSGASRNSETEVCAPWNDCRKWTEGRRRGSESSFPSSSSSPFLQLFPPPPFSSNFLILLLSPSLKLLPPPLSISLHGGSPPSQNSLQAPPAASAPSKTAPFCQQPQQLPHDKGGSKCLVTQCYTMAVSCYTVLHNVTKSAVSVTTSWRVGPTWQCLIQCLYNNVTRYTILQCAMSVNQCYTMLQCSVSINQMFACPFPDSAQCWTGVSTCYCTGDPR